MALNKKEALMGLLDKSKKKKTVTEKAAAAKPAAKVNHGKVVNYYVEYEDGTVGLAQDKHAHLIYRFTMEAQQLATMHGYAYYEGPPLTEMPKAEALKILATPKEVKS